MNLTGRLFVTSELVFVLYSIGGGLSVRGTAWRWRSVLNHVPSACRSERWLLGHADALRTNDVRHGELQMANSFV